MPGTLAKHASMLYAKNLSAFLNYIAPQIEKNEYDLSDEIIKNTLVISQGNIVNAAVNAALQQKG